MPQLLERAAGLTTTPDPSIHSAQRQPGDIFIEQPYHLYSPQNHQTWRHLYSRMIPRWEKYANQHFLQGVHSLCLDSERVPRLDDVNRFLCPLTGFRAKAVSGYIPAFLFFDCLRNREFPTTIGIRSEDAIDYLPEPDIFHDIAGHVPMHTDPAFAETLVRFGQCAQTAVEIVSGMRDERLRLQRLTSIIRAMARFFWFTVEFGLMNTRNGMRAYGSGLLSSYGELQHSLQSSDIQRCPIDLEWAVNQAFEIHHYQPLLFTVESFDALYSLVDRLESWMRQGKLNDVAPGEPEVSEADLRSFLQRSER